MTGTIGPGKGGTVGTGSFLDQILGMNEPPKYQPSALKPNEIAGYSDPSIGFDPHGNSVSTMQRNAATGQERPVDSNYRSAFTPEDAMDK